VVDEIFDQIDIDGNGEISKEEFIVKYIDSHKELLERKHETMRNIVDHAR